MSSENIELEVEPPTPSSPVDKGKKKAKDFFASQNAMIKQMMQQQASFMKQMGFDDPEIATADGPSSRSDLDHDDVELLPRSGEYAMELSEDPWTERNSGDLTTDSGDIGDLDLEVVLSSKYQLMLDQTEEELGDPLSSELAKVCAKAWGQARLDKEKKKELVKDVRVPSNCLIMKTPKLNTEIYVRLGENHQSKDRAAQERQKDLTKAVTSAKAPR